MCWPQTYQMFVCVTCTKRIIYPRMFCPSLENLVEMLCSFSTYLQIHIIFFSSNSHSMLFLSLILNHIEGQVMCLCVCLGIHNKSGKSWLLQFGILMNRWSKNRLVKKDKLIRTIFWEMQVIFTYDNLTVMLQWLEEFGSNYWTNAVHHVQIHIIKSITSTTLGSPRVNVPVIIIVHLLEQ